jgi:hypothetical protein
MKSFRGGCFREVNDVIDPEQRGFNETSALKRCRFRALQRKYGWFHAAKCAWLDPGLFCVAVGHAVFEVFK